MEQSKVRNLLLQFWAQLNIKNVTKKQIKKAKWKSSSKKVATVSGSGKITAKKAGKTTISVKVAGKTLKCTVTVKKAGSTTKTDDTQIRTAADLSKLEGSAKEFNLAADIDASGYTAVNTFSGKLNGNGHTIRNLKTPLVEINKGSIDGIIFQNVQINSERYSHIAAVAGLNAQGASISNCKVYGSIRGTAPVKQSAQRYAIFVVAGGIAGQSRGKITNCENYAAISIYNSEKGAAGGITANNWGVIENCKNVGEVTMSGISMTIPTY